MGRLIAAGQWTAGDPEILIVADAGYDVTRLAFVLADLPVVLLGRLRSDRVLRLPAPPRLPRTSGRPPRHGGEFALARPEPWPAPQHITSTNTRAPEAADRWTWLIIAAHTQLRLARPLAEDLRKPWERPAAARRLTPARVRRDFRNIRTTAACPAGAPKPGKPGPGRPPGS